MEMCAGCHGASLEGGMALSLLGSPLVNGDAVEDIARVIATGLPEWGMPAFATVLDEAEIRGIAIYISERRLNRHHSDVQARRELALPEGLMQTQAATFKTELVASDIAAKPFSIAPLPDGSLLLTEKTNGLFVISSDGQRSDPIAGTPKTGKLVVRTMGLDYGIGWLLDVAPHPDYEENGWIYLAHTHLCDECTGLRSGSMLRVVRGRIIDGTWQDQEVIWSVPDSFYTPVPDISVGGRLAFDTSGHLYLSVGLKGLDGTDVNVGIQDLSAPYGKVHRMRDDGGIPQDNPFASDPTAIASTWTYGHRNPQGLEFDPRTQTLWATEMGPRGGDEINWLRAGRNYGWPFHSLGVHYDGTPVEHSPGQGVEFNMEDFEQPVVDLTPSPAISSFIIYDGPAFPGWKGHFIAGSLRATELYRFVIQDGQLIHTETLMEDLARIRDVEAGPEGNVYLLLESESGSKIFRLVPASE